ncbi:Glucose-methanol-choline oxidoreductase [Artemisia annua]|uniref:Glucose-methanol-choline oxidoreductase n=1 Tax=Artemisia annua TaxID=35608 RepID=A0A2U1MKW0_ARTAN|nr:Glucose-methanol-choline oxidoreductase [Artemisia annua]
MDYVRTTNPSSYVARFIFTLIVFFASSSTSEKAPYATFAKDATEAPEVTSYDYIIVGGGTSGCALAATLSQGAKVLVLERGDLPYGIPSINTINGFIDTLANLGPTSPSQTFVSTDGVLNQRARVLGGGSAINAGFFTRASPDFINKAGLDPKLVRESYEWVEKKVEFEPEVLPWQAAVRDGLLEAGILPNNGFTLEHLYGTKIGGSIFDRNGRRHTAADLLEYADPSNITVYLNATVHRILYKPDGNNINSYKKLQKMYPFLAELKAIGVLYKDMKGKQHTAVLNEGSLLNEVILSAGTLGSPQLLMLSGIGPAEHLTAHKIKVVFDQPMVGQGLSDNPMNIVLVPTTMPVEISLIEVVGITRFGSFIESASAHINLPLLTKFGSQFAHFVNKTPNIDKLRSDIGRRLNLDLSGLNAGLILEKVMGPLSLGVLELETLNPEDSPKVTFNYFKDPRDLQSCVQGMETIVKVLESKALSKFRDPLLSVNELLALVVALPLNLRPRHINAPFNLEQYCKDTVMSIWHYHGGCQVDRVVDRNYRVVGVGALRVIDSSTLLNSPGTNPQATMMMLGR